MSIFKEKYESLLIELNKGKTMVLSTSENNKVSSRMMSIVCFDGLFYFQTDKNFRKYNQLISNPHVALCTENIQVEGICKEIGHPMDNPKFCKVYKDAFVSSFHKYSFLQNERLFVVKPTYIERWRYIDGIPFIEIFNVENKEYELNKYEG